MRKNLHHWGRVLLVLIFGACGVTYEEGGIAFTYVDNSELSFQQNSFGYFGYDVLFGEAYIVGDWILYDTDSYDTIFAHFYDNGTVLTDGRLYDYGVSRDGLAIYTSAGKRIEIITSHPYRYLNDIPCYRVEIVDLSYYATGDMCPQ